MLAHRTALPKPTPRSCSHGYARTYLGRGSAPSGRARLLKQGAVHSLELIGPEEVIGVVQTALQDSAVTFAKVMMSLGEILTGDFFTQYIKAGNIMMMSEGRLNIDNRFELIDGVLKIEVDRPTYERAGLTGTRIPDGGPKHANNRYAIEINLRMPSMLHGKKGFERIKWACKNVFVQSLTWLFHEFPSEAPKDGARPIDKFHPRWFTIRPTHSRLPRVRVPSLVDSNTSETALNSNARVAADVEEWLSLVALGSPRVEADDDPNSFICRYSFPSPKAVTDEEIVEKHTTVADLAKLTWAGFMPASLVLRVLAVARRKSKERVWWAIRSKGLRYDHDTVTLLHRPSSGVEAGEYYCWHKVGGAS